MGARLVITGHFGLAAAVKASERALPLWSLMLATVWLDVLFVPLLAAGVETIEDAPGTDGGYGDAIIHADWTHSLVGALAIAAVTAWLVRRWWGDRGAVVIGLVVLSHWVLDFLVHRDDLPLLPGNAGGVRVGLGLWESHGATIAVEAALLAVGAALYWRAARAAERDAGIASGGRATLVASLIVLFGAAVLALDVTVG